MKEEEGKDIIEDDDSVDPRIYEVGFLIVPEIAEEKVPEITSSLKTAIEEERGFYVSEGFPKLRPLSYTIIRKQDHRGQKYEQAYFGWLKFEISPEKIVNIKRFLENNANILRFIILNTVRENTLYSQRMATAGRKDKVYKKEEPRKEEASQEEIDKSIEELVAS